MHIRDVIVRVAVLAFVLSLPCGLAAAESAAEKAVVAKVIDDSIGWFKDKDFERLFGTLADDPDLFMYQPTSDATIRGIEDFRRFSAVWKNPEVRYASHAIRDLAIRLSRSGDVAWFRALLDDCSETKGRVGCWKDCRWTGVLEKREGRWVIVQMHFSFAADKVRDQVVQSLKATPPASPPNPQ